MSAVVEANTERDTTTPLMAANTNLEKLEKQRSDLKRSIEAHEATVKRLEDDYEKIDDLVTAENKLSATQRVLITVEKRIAQAEVTVAELKRAEYESEVTAKMSALSLEAQVAVRQLSSELSEADRALQESASRVRELLDRREALRDEFWALGAELEPGVAEKRDKFQGGSRAPSRADRLTALLPNDEARAAVTTYTSQRRGVVQMDERRLSDVLDLPSYAKLVLRAADPDALSWDDLDDLKELADAWSVSLKRKQEKRTWAV